MALINNQIINGGGQLILVFKNGSTETIPLNKVHINASGTTSLPSNCFPIVADTKEVKSNHDGTGYTDLYANFGDTKILNVKNHRNDKQHNTYGQAFKVYLPSCVNSLNALKSGKFTYGSNYEYQTNGSEKYYVYADKE